MPTTIRFCDWKSRVLANSRAMATRMPNWVCFHLLWRHCCHSEGKIRKKPQTIGCQVNSYPTSATYMLQCIESALVEIMACRLFVVVKPSSKLLLSYCQLTLRNKLQWKFSQITNLCIRGNATVVCEMAAILSRGSWVDISMIFCQKGPTRHAHAWQIGPFWQDTLDILHRAMAADTNVCIMAPSHHLHLCRPIIRG